MIRLIASLGYAGYSPVAPGTAGTAVAAVLFWLCREWPAPVHAALALFILAVGIPVAGRAEQSYGQADCGKIVIDECAGFWISVLFLPTTLPVVVLAFFVFRFFDIAKVFPANLIERRLPGGWGVMLDDAVAGLYTNLVLRAGVALFGPGLFFK